MQSMRAAVVDSVPGVPTIQDVEISEPGLGEVLIRTVATGVCHSDLHVMDGTGMSMPTPFVLGHEPAGIVEAVGSGVRRPPPGDHVVGCLSALLRPLLPVRHAAARTSAQRRVGVTNPAKARAIRARRRAGHADRRAGRASPSRCSSGIDNVVKVREEMPLDRGALLGCAVLTGVGVGRQHRAGSGRARRSS